MKNRIIKHERKPDASEEELLLEYDEFFKRIQKSLYFGLESEDMVSPQMAEYASKMFNQLQQGHSLNRLSVETAGQTMVQCSYLIIAFIYLDRLQESDPEFARKITPTELFLISMIISTKFNVDYDGEIYIDLWSENFNISVDAIKKLEIDFLNALDWKAFVSNEEYFAKLEEIELILARNEFAKRGWLTYTELVTLSPTIEWRKILKDFICYNISIAFSYALGFLTIASAFIVASHVPGNLLSKPTAVSSPAVDLGIDSCNQSMTVQHSTTEILKSNNLSTDDITDEYDELIRTTMIMLNSRLSEPPKPENDEPSENVDNSSCPYFLTNHYGNDMTNQLNFDSYNAHLSRNESSMIFNYKTPKWLENYGNIWSFWYNKYSL